MLPFDIKNSTRIIPCCHGNHFMRECLAKNHDQKEENWHF